MSFLATITRVRESHRICVEVDMEISELCMSDAVYPVAGGKTPVTWYPESYTSLNMTDMAMRPNGATGYPGRTYRFHTLPVVYEFGHGLSFSAFEYRFSSQPLHLNIPADQDLHCPTSSSGMAHMHSCSCVFFFFSFSPLLVPQSNE